MAREVNHSRIRPRRRQWNKVLMPLHHDSTAETPECRLLTQAQGMQLTVYFWVPTAGPDSDCTDRERLSVPVSAPGCCFGAEFVPAGQTVGPASSVPGSPRPASLSTQLSRDRRRDSQSELSALDNGSGSVRRIESGYTPVPRRAAPHFSDIVFRSQGPARQEVLVTCEPRALLAVS